MGIRSLISSTASHLFPSNALRAPPRDTAWADGLRGIAAVGVVSSHIVLAFWTEFAPPCVGGPGGPSLLFQRPFFRLVVQGQAWVAIFFILMGFVNPLKPLRQASLDNIEGALTSLGKAGINRAARLVLPAAAVTVIAWFCCQVGMFQVARHSGAYWLQSNSPDPSDSFVHAVGNLTVALKNTWVTGNNIYDQPQWALEYLLKGSMYILLLLLITMHATPRFRMFALFGWWCASWAKGEALVGHNIVPGMILAELHNLGVRPFESRLAKLATYPTATLGLYLMSFPSEYQNWTHWTNQLYVIGSAIYPAHGDLSRFWCGIGGSMLCFSIYFNPHFRALFSLPIVTWLGSISFSLYLLHGTMMRTLLAWMTYGLQYIEDPEPDYGTLPPPGGLTLFVCLPIWAAITLGISQLWTEKVEPYFGRATSALQTWSVTMGASSSSLSRNGGGPSGGGSSSPRGSLLPTSSLLHQQQQQQQQVQMVQTPVLLGGGRLD